MTRIGFCMLLALASTVRGEVVYRNDFSTRTSTGAVPDADWHELVYPAGKGKDLALYRNYSVDDKFVFATATPWEKNDGYWDEWGKAYMDQTTMKAGAPGLWAVSDPASDVDNPCAVFRSSAKRSGTAVAPLHNEFTNGILCIEADIRRPAVWGGTAGETYCCRVVPLYRKALDLNWGKGINDASLGAFPVMFGAVIDGNGKDAAAGVNRLIMYYAKEDGSRTSFCPGGYENYVCSTNWYRWRVYMDLDRGRINAYIWDAGATQPSAWNEQADSTATRKVENATYFLSSPLTKASGGVAGLALNCYRTLSGTDANFVFANAPAFDNLRVAWKAPDGNDYKSGSYETVYENDFKTRRYRTLQPVGGPATTSCVYPRDVGTTAKSVFKNYTVKENRDDVNRSGLLVRSKVGDGVQPVGTDNWRRLSGNGAATVINPGAGSAGASNLRIDGSKSYIVLGTRIGETVTSGKVRVSADVRLPAQWRQDSRRVCLALGGLAHWTDINYTGTDIGYGAIVGDTSNDAFFPAYLPASGSLVSTKDVTVPCNAKEWYRMVVTADLDAKTYDYTLYALGAEAVASSADPGAPIYTITGIGFRNAVDEISSLSIWAYGAGDVWDDFILWDSFKVWKNVDTASEKLIYENTFGQRVYHLDQEMTPLTGGFRVEGEGVDHWVSAGFDDVDVRLLGDANRVLSANVPGDGRSWAVQSMGSQIDRGRVRVTVDMRPPNLWSARDRNRNRINFYLGGPVFAQGLMMKDDGFVDRAAMTFGFFQGSETQMLGFYTNVTLRAVDGQTMADRAAPKACEADHWYRFVATAKPADRMWSLKAYDLGTTHPDVDTPTPAETFAAFDNLTWRAGAEDALSALGLTAGGCQGWQPWDVYDSGNLLVDNIVVERLPLGLTLHVR